MNGWADEHLGLRPQAYRVPVVARSCPVVWDLSGLPCGDKAFSRGWCVLHYCRVRAGWPEAALGLPPKSRKPKPACERQPCPVPMDRGGQCGRPVEIRGMCVGHDVRQRNGFPRERMGESWASEPRCGHLLVGQTKRCRIAVDAAGERCPDHSGDPGTSTGGSGFAEHDAQIRAIVAKGAHEETTELTHRYQKRRFSVWAQARGVHDELPIAPAIWCAYIACHVAPALHPEWGRTEPFSWSYLVKARSSLVAAHGDAGLTPPTADPVVASVTEGAKRRLRGLEAPPIEPLTAAEIAELIGVRPSPSKPVAQARLGLTLAAATNFSFRDIASISLAVRQRIVVVTTIDGRSTVIDEEAARSAVQAAYRVAVSCGADGRQPLLDLQPSDPTGPIAYATFLKRIRFAGRAAGATIGGAEDVRALDADTFRRVDICLDPQDVLWHRDRAIILTALHLGMSHKVWSTLRWGTQLRRIDAGYEVVGVREVTITLEPSRDGAFDGVAALDDWVGLRCPAEGTLVFVAARTGSPRGDVVLRDVNFRKRLRGLAVGTSVEGRANLGSKSLELGFVTLAIKKSTDSHGIAVTAGRKTVAPIEARRRRLNAHGGAKSRAKRMQT